MRAIEDIKVAKVIGRQLRKAREEQGHNLAILAPNLGLSVVRLIAIEEGNASAFGNSISMLIAHARQYANELGIMLSGIELVQGNSQDNAVEDLDSPIPLFLRKRDS